MKYKNNSESNLLAIAAKKTYRKGEYICIQESSTNNLYVVVGGTVKIFFEDEDYCQILHFACEGEMFGAFGVDKNCQHSATALNEVSVLVINQSMIHSPALKLEILHRVSKALTTIKKHTRSLHTRVAAELKLIRFILWFKDRQIVSRLKPGSEIIDFHLPMSQSEIGNYLGLSAETVCRKLTKFQIQGLIELEGRRMHILNITAMRELAKLRW